MEHKLAQQISLAPEKKSPTSSTLENSSSDQHSAIKSKILNFKNFKDFIEMMISELINRNQIENRRPPQGLDSFRRTLSISLEQEQVLRSPEHEKYNYIFP